MMTPQEKAIVEKAANELAEHFENLQIFVNKHDGNAERTTFYHHGCGNIFAREGQVRDWLIRLEQYSKTSADIQQREDLENGEE